MLGCHVYHACAGDPRCAFTSRMILAIVVPADAHTRKNCEVTLSIQLGRSSAFASTAPCLVICSGLAAWCLCVERLLLLEIISLMASSDRGCLEG